MKSFERQLMDLRAAAHIVLGRVDMAAGMQAHMDAAHDLAGAARRVVLLEHLHGELHVLGEFRRACACRSFSDRASRLMSTILAPAIGMLLPFQVRPSTPAPAAAATRGTTATAAVGPGATTATATTCDTTAAAAAAAGSDAAAAATTSTTTTAIRAYACAGASTAAAARSAGTADRLIARGPVTDIAIAACAGAAARI